MDTEILVCGYSYHRKPFILKNEILDTFLFRLQVQGKSMVRINGNSLDMEPGNLLLLKPGDLYELKVDGESRSGDYFILCKGTWIQDWWESFEPQPFNRIPLDERILSLWDHLYLENHQTLIPDNQLVDYLFRSLCLSLKRTIQGTNAVHKQPPNTKFVADLIKRYIEDHFMEQFSIEDLAKNVGLSVSRASHLFKETYGITIIQSAINMRLKNAIDRMRYTPMTLEVIAESCGFGSYSYFHKAFKKRFGISPKEYRDMFDQVDHNFNEKLTRITAEQFTND
ncbi:AraC family transcriptional regulator [Bacillus sp. USDA818B3_A]|uniref:AraC family transcriptional regulator n=1 Tax=Bacillus sp. USDA818B3_A TaxID=2698834 RepID=UPI00136CE0E6|nr:AraC family transcriptional regulator [Bacillus sp. USDA818B3_A]